MNTRDAESDPLLNQVPICAIGASAGGIAALQTLFRLLPDDLGLAFVVVVHLAPDQPSALSGILSLCTRMPVVQVPVAHTLRPNEVFVIAPSRELTVRGDTITSRPHQATSGGRWPIDLFLRSIAAARGNGMAVILSGAGADGSQGVRFIKAAGGVVLVQEPGEAAFASMPQHAIGTGAVDFVLPIARLAERIGEIARSKEAVRSLDPDVSANDLRRIVTFLRTKVGHDFSSYKRATVLRRVRRRMQVCRTDTLAAYFEHLSTAREEPALLLADLLVSVTSFFRDPKAFEVLARTVVCPLVHDHDQAGGDALRIWCVGCASGEEAFSVAMLLLEARDERRSEVPIQIFATDIDEEALKRARSAFYPRSIAEDVSAERLSRFFNDEGSGYRVRQEVRDIVLFSTHGVLREPPFLRLDLVVCRNLLIYMERSAQEQIGSLFHYALKPGRYLFLGSAETSEATGDFFAPLSREARLYVSRSRATYALPVLPQHLMPDRHGTATAVDPANADPVRPVAVHARMLERLAPPSVLVDGSGGILHLSPSAGRFILHSDGPMSHQLPLILRPELRLDLTLALTRASDRRTGVLTPTVKVAFDDGPHLVAMHVLPLQDDADAGHHLLVMLLDGGPVGSEELLIGGGMPDDTARALAELKIARDALIRSRGEHDLSIQDLRATNEELQSVNEEYRSTAEELETSKEELQSINEELQTVNAELKSRLDSTSMAHSDLENLIAATDIGTLFLAPDLRIKMFTPAAAELFNVTRADFGRPITDFTNNLRDVDLRRDVRQVVSDVLPIEREVVTDDGRWFVMRTRPYRTIDGRVDGAVLTFVDITARMSAEAAQAESEERFRTLVRASSQVLYRMTGDWGEMRELSGGGFLTDTDMPTTDWLDRYIPTDEQATVLAAIRRAVENGEVFELEHRVLRSDGSVGWGHSRAVPIMDDRGNVTEWFGAAVDTTTRREAAQTISRANDAREQQVADGNAELALYRFIVEGSSDPICAFDTDGRVTVFNQAQAVEWHRVTGRDARRGEALTDLVPSGQAGAERGFAERALSGEAFTVRTDQASPAPGIPRTTVRYAPIRNELGVIVGAFRQARGSSARSTPGVDGGPVPDGAAHDDAEGRP